MYDKERGSRHHYQGRAGWYDWANRFSSLIRGVSGTKERRKAVERLKLKTDGRALEISVGTGTNLPLMAECLGPEGRLVGLDISAATIQSYRW